MRNAHTFAGLTFALALVFSSTTAAQTSSKDSKQQASPDQSQKRSAGNMHRDRVGERLESQIVVSLRAGTNFGQALCPSSACRA